MNLRNIKLLSIFNFLIGFSLFAPLAIIYFSQVSRSFTLGTSIFGIIMISSAIFEVPTGVWSDVIGRKQTVVMGSFFRLLGYISYAIGLSYGWLVLGAILEGLSRSLYSGNNDALLYDTLNDNNALNDYEEIQGKVSSAEQFAMGISAVFSGLVALFTFKYLLYFSVVVQVGLLITSVLLQEPKSRRKTNTNIQSHLKEAIFLFIKNKKLRLLSVASIISYSISELKWEFSSAFVATVWPVWAVGISKSLPSIGASLSFYYSGKIIKKFKAVKILLFDNVYGKFISLVSLIFPTFLSPILMATPSFLFGVSIVAEKTLMNKEFSDHQRATMSSLNSLGGSVGLAIMSIVLGSLADVFGPAKAMLILTFVSLPATYLYWVIFRGDGNDYAKA